MLPRRRDSIARGLSLAAVAIEVHQGLTVQGSPHRSELASMETDATHILEARKKADPRAGKKAVCHALMVASLSPGGRLAKSPTQARSQTGLDTIDTMRTQAFASLAVVIDLAMHAPAAVAQRQGLPDPPRSVYKCEVNGKVTYSDEPCLGATRVELQPTRGLNKSSGKERVGTDVTRERQHEAFAEAVRPLTGMNPEELQKAGQRSRLAPKVQEECRVMDAQIARTEARQTVVAGAELTTVQQALYAMRKRHRAIGC